MKGYMCFLWPETQKEGGKWWLLVKIIKFMHSGESRKINNAYYRMVGKEVENRLFKQTKQHDCSKVRNIIMVISKVEKPLRYSFSLLFCQDTLNCKSAVLFSFSVQQSYC